VRDRPLTIRDTVALAEIIRWAQTTAAIRWVDPNTGSVETGTARSIGDERGNFTPPDADIRDEHLRITTSRGWEWFVPMRDAMDMVMDGRMADA
jgi:hypothetical protein